jgi:hypothetical protein
MTGPRFTHSRTSSAAPDERVPRGVADHRLAVISQYLAFTDDQELGRRLEKVPNERQVRTDAVAAIEEESADGWVVRWVVAEQDGVFVARSLRIEPIGQLTPPGGITARLLRELSPARALSNLSLSAAEKVDMGEGQFVHDDFTPLLIKWARQDVQSQEFATEAARGPGRPRLSDETLARVAVAYLEELPHGPGLLARIGARPEIDRPADTVRDWVRRARQSGFLTGTKAGRKGASAGPRLIDFVKGRIENDG